MQFCMEPVVSSKMAQALSYENFEFQFAGAAPGDPGVIFKLLPGQRAASPSIFLAMGGAAAITSATMTTAIATALVGNDGEQTTQIPLNYNTAAETAAIILGLVNHFAQIEVGAADGDDAIGWCVRGLPIKDIAYVELVIRDITTMLDVVIAQAGPAKLIPEPVTLGANSLIKDAAAAEIDFDTAADRICLIRNRQIAFGSLNVVTILSAAPAVGDILVLKIKAII